VEGAEVGGAVAGIELPEGDPGAVDGAAASMRGCAAGFEGAGATAVRAAASVPGWSGLASFTFRSRCGSYRDAAVAAEGVCARAATVLRSYGRELADARERVRELQRRAEECVERIRAAEQAAADAAQRAAAASHMAYQASFAAGADAGALRASFQQQADDAWGEQTRALDRAAAARDELEELRRKAQEERERIKEAGARAAGEISALAGDLPEVAFPGAPAAASTSSGPRPPAVLLGRGGTPAAGYPTALTDEERAQIAAYEQSLRDAEDDGPPGIVTFAGDLLGINDAKQAGEDFGDGNILGGIFHAAMAWPGGKVIKGLKEGGEEVVERAVKETGDESAERAAREGFERDPAFKGTPGEHLPVYRGGKTEGMLDTGTERYHITSGVGRPSIEIPLGKPWGFNGNIKTHVEAHVATLMRKGDLKQAELWINNAPCSGVRGCDAMLPRMLPEGSELTVHGPGNVVKVYKGLADG
jgi:nucleic acid/nucleotide deaminase of polymorphic system toxin